MDEHTEALVNGGGLKFGDSRNEPLGALGAGSNRVEGMAGQAKVVDTVDGDGSCGAALVFAFPFPFFKVFALGFG